MQLDPLVRDYLEHVKRRSWGASDFRGKFALEPDASEETLQTVLAFTVGGYANEFGASLLYSQVLQQQRTRLDEAWHLAAPFWLADEMRHTQVFYAFHQTLGQALPHLADDLLPVTERKQQYADFVAECIEEPMDFWAAIVLDEHNTCGEYVAAGDALFHILGPDGPRAMKKMASDEARHFQLGIGMLRQYGDPSRARDRLERMESFAREANRVGELFLFDQDPVGDFRPDFRAALKKCMRVLDQSSPAIA